MSCPNIRAAPTRCPSTGRRRLTRHGRSATTCGRPDRSTTKPHLLTNQTPYKDEAYFQQKRSTIIGNRESLTATLIQLGFDVLPSSANFVFVRHPSHTGQALSAALRERAVLVRHLSGARVLDFIRITFGSSAAPARMSEPMA